MTSSSCGPRPDRADAPSRIPRAWKSAPLAAVLFGKPIAASSIGHFFQFNRTELIVLLAAYGFVASVLPVWLLLTPRDYLSSFMKIGTISALVLGVVIVNPELRMPAFTEFT